MQAMGDDTPLMAHSNEAVLSKMGKFFLPFEAKGTALASTQYALHLDAVAAGQYLRRYAEQAGVKRTVAEVEHVELNTQGEIAWLTCNDQLKVEGDFFIDCSGFKGVLIEEALQAGYEDWSEFLPCNRAVAVQSELKGDIAPYTVATAKDAGWTWQIPLQSRMGNGYVFCDKYCSDQQAIETLLSQIDGEPLTEPRVIPFTTGLRKRPWHKNCLSLGLAQGFLEPLESTAIHLVSKSLALFVRMFPQQGDNQCLIDEYNRRVREDYIEIRDFLVLHYCTTLREDTPFWQACKQMSIPATLANRLAFFKHQGGLIPQTEALFQPTSWYAVLEGMGVKPIRYNATLDGLDANKLHQSLTQGANAIIEQAKRQPSHREFVERYCKSER